nr:MAG TPA: hypothetical protein [Caudoviricetes sp.]
MILTMSFMRHLLPTFLLYQSSLDLSMKVWYNN